MREDYRCDIRTGPNLSHLHQSITSLQHDPTVNTIMTLACNSTDRGSRTSNNLHLGNYGLYNFNGPGPLGPFLPLKTSSGCVVSLPGCGGQAVHSDTAHVLDEVHNRPHYINAFYNTGLSSSSGGRLDFEKGQTAFAVGSHRLEVCKVMTEGGDVGRSLMEMNVVRPHVECGDIVMFDARVLHWGTENRWKGEDENDTEKEDKNIKRNEGWRGIFYVNYWREFFQDPKNWDERESVFD